MGARAGALIRRRLRVAVSPALRSHSPATGHGRLWAQGLPELARLARLREGPRGADVWLADGYDVAPPGQLPAVAYVAEAPWSTPEALQDVEPGFIALMSERLRATGGRCARLTVPSTSSRAQVAAYLGFEEGRIDVVPLGVDVSVFGAGRADAGLARVGAPYVLFASQLHPRKNLAALREAMALLAADGVRRTLAVVVSPATDRAASDDLHAAALAPIPGVPVVAVERPDDRALADLMAGADAFCQPSLFEGFGLTAAEALAAGAPTVVSDRGSLPEVVADAGLVAAPDAEGLAAALRRVLTDPALAADLRDRGRHRAAALTWAATARGWLASLQRAVSVS